MLQKENKESPPWKNTLPKHLFALWSQRLNWNLTATSKITKLWDGVALWCCESLNPKASNQGVWAWERRTNTILIKTRLLCSKQAEKHQPWSSTACSALHLPVLPLPSPYAFSPAPFLPLSKNSHVCGYICHFLNCSDLCFEQMLRNYIKVVKTTIQNESSKGQYSKTQIKFLVQGIISL